MNFIIMPKLDWAMTEGTVGKWLKKVGDRVEKGEVVVEVESEKVTYEVEASASGVLRRILVSEGTEVPVGREIAILAEPDEELPEVEVAKVTTEEQVVQEERKIERLIERAERIRASPSAKRLAKEHGIDLTQLVSIGFRGRITKEDVLKFIEERATPRVREVIPLTGIRKLTAERMTLSERTAPHVTITMEIDASNMMNLRQKMSSNQVSYTDMFVLATAKALEEYLIINSTLDNDNIKIFDDINIGVATATERGLMVPVIRNANKKSLREIASIMKELIKKAKEGSLTKKELTGGTFTITNLGMFGVDVFTPIILPSQTAILGIGRINEKPTITNGKIAARPILYLSLSFDHRVLDGVPAAKFLNKIKENLETPSLLEE